MFKIHKWLSHNNLYFMRFEVLMVVKLWITVHWNVTSCSVADIYPHFKGTSGLHLLLQWKPRQRIPSKHWQFYTTTWHHILEHGIALVHRNYSNKNGLVNKPFIAFYVRSVLHKKCYVWTLLYVSKMQK